ncbi:MAG: NUDIX hydrolase [Desulfobacterota bacterium]|nr:NUDIX hydrolase [Thermodesulfobacteriota bacterium]
MTQRRPRFLNITVENVRLPNGRVRPFEMVRHPGAVVIVPFITENSVIILKQFRPVIRRFIYEFPAGTLEAGERPSSCARRELQEETGYRAKKMTRLGIIYPVPGYSTEQLVIYKAEGLIPVSVSCEDDEVIKAEVFTKDQIIKLVRSGKLIDAKTICCLVLCGWL